jgi:hypothetical protein
MVEQLILAAIILFGKAMAVNPSITPPPNLSNRQISSPADSTVGYVNLGGSCKYIAIPVNFGLGLPAF